MLFGVSENYSLAAPAILSLYHLSFRERDTERIQHLLFTEIIHDTPVIFWNNKPFTVTWTYIYID